MKILGTDFKVCEVYDGWGVNGAANSCYYDYGWEDLPFLLGE